MFEQLKFKGNTKFSIRKKLMIPLLGSFLLFLILYIAVTQILIKSNFREFKRGVIEKLFKLESRTEENITSLSEKTRVYYNEVSKQLEAEKTNEITRIFENSMFIGYTFTDQKLNELSAKAQVLTNLKEVEHLIGSGIVESGNLHKRGEYYEQTFVKARGLTAIYKLVNNVQKRMWPEGDTTIDVKIFLKDGKVVGKSRRTNYRSFYNIYNPDNIELILNENEEVVQDVIFSLEDGLAYQTYVPIRDVYNVLSGGMIITYPLNKEYISELAKYTGNEVMIFDVNKCYASTFENEISSIDKNELFNELKNRDFTTRELMYKQIKYRAAFYPIKDVNDKILGVIGYAVNLIGLEESLDNIVKQQETTLYLLQGLKAQSLNLFEKDIKELDEYLQILEQRINNITFRIIGVLLLLALIYFLGTIAYISRIIIGPITKLNEGVQNIRAGKYGSKVEVNTNDEFAYLAEGFNKMNLDLKRNFEQINDQKNKLEDLNKNLEKKVAKRTESIQKQKKELEKQNQEITDSILYAESIQNSILPKDLDLVKKTKDHFVIWRPRDIVGGDFYWFKEVEDGFFIALIDCTGHGVPGALMSMKAEALLNRIINDDHTDNPAKVLAELNHALKLELYHDATNEKIDEGLDIGLCFINEKTNILSFSGAKISLYFSDQLELNIIKGDKQSIGYRRSKLNFVYRNHYLEINERKNFYMTSDGYPDQNNAHNASFGRKKFADTLEASFHLSMRDQKQIFEEVLDNFKDEEKQRDDITVLGFKV